MAKLIYCPCGSGQELSGCCGRYLDGAEVAPTAEVLMRSRYTAYTLLREEYLLATWHASTCPTQLGLAEDVPTKWLGLEIKRHEQRDDTHAIVEFVARYKVNGRARRLHEVSRFMREAGRWFYLDGDIEATPAAAQRLQ